MADRDIPREDAVQSRERAACAADCLIAADRVIASARPGGSHRRERLERHLGRQAVGGGVQVHAGWLELVAEHEGPIAGVVVGQPPVGQVKELRCARGSRVHRRPF